MSTFDKDAIHEKRIKRVTKLTDSEDFAPEKIAKSSKAAANFTLWVVAIVDYHKARCKVNKASKKQ